MSDSVFHTTYEETSLFDPKLPHRLCVWLDETRPNRIYAEDRRLMVRKRVEIKLWMEEIGWIYDVDYTINADTFGCVDWYYFRTKAMVVMVKLAIS
ncbi:hypothetical protein D3C87_666670 [compost metagenome]